MAKPLTTKQARMVAMVLYGKELPGGHGVIGQVAHGRSRGYMVGYSNTLGQRSTVTGESHVSYVSAFIVAAGDDANMLHDALVAIEAVQHPERAVECPHCQAQPGERCYSGRRGRFGKRHNMDRSHPERYAEHKAHP